MDETTNAIPNYSHTHGVYGNYGYGNYGRNDDGVLVDLINKNDLNSSIREVGRAVDIGATATAQAIAGVAKSQSDGVISTSGLITDLGRDINNGVHNTLVQNLNSFNQLDKTITQNSNMIVGQGTAILAEMARCCCETKQLISSEANTTRALITDNRMHDLEDKLNQSRLKASQAEQTNTILSALQSNGPGNN